MKYAFRALIFGISVLCVGLAAFGQQNVRHPRKYVPPPATARVQVTVVKGWNGRPILNAAVVFRTSEDGKDRGSMELKTNEEGKAELDLIPVGSKLRLQVIANGYQTYGDDYTVDSATKTIVVKMNKPTKLYSIYDPNAPAAANSPAAPNAPAAKTDDKSAPAGSVPELTDPKRMPPDHAAPPPAESTKPNSPQPR